MTYTFKLARRLARLRTGGLVAATLLGLACSADDSPIGPESPPSELDPTSLVVSPDSAAVAVNGKIQFAATTDPVVSLRLTPAAASVGPRNMLRFSGSAETASGDSVGPSLTWKATGGSIGRHGMYRAGRVAGNFLVIGTAASGVADTAAVTITGTPPVVAQVVLSPESTTLPAGGNQLFIALGKATDGSTVAASIKFVATGGTVSPEGRYYAGPTPGVFQVVATDTVTGASDTSAVTIGSPTSPPPPPPPSPTLEAVVLTPATASVATGATQQFTASGRMSDGSTASVTTTWTAGGGTVSPAGLYGAGQTAGTYRVIAAATGGKADTATVTIAAPPSTPPPPTSGCDTLKTDLQFVGQFEGDKWYKWWSRNEGDAMPHMLTRVTSQVNECTSALRVELRRTDPLEAGHKRAEIKLLQDSVNASVAGPITSGKPGTETWMGWSLYIPSDWVFETGSAQETVSQIKGCTSGRSPVWEIQIDKGNFEVWNRFGSSGSLVQLMAGTRPVTKGAWHHFVLHAKWRGDNTGVLEVWMNGTKFVDRQNTPTVWSDCSGDLDKIKFGIYKWSWNGTTSGGSSIVSSRVLYLDNVRVTGATGSYADVVPSGDGGSVAARTGG